MKNRPWSVAHTRIPNIRKSPPPEARSGLRNVPVDQIGGKAICCRRQDTAGGLGSCKPPEALKTLYF